MYALFFLLIVSCFWKIWKTLSGRKWSIIQTHSLWKSRCAFTYYKSVSKERESFSLFPGEKSWEYCVWHISNGVILQNVAPSNWVLAVFMQIRASELISKWYEKWGWVCSPANAHWKVCRTCSDFLAGTTGVTCRASERAPEREPQQEHSSGGLCVSFICLAFSSSELQLDFLAPSCLESTGQWLGLNSWVPGLALAQGSENSKWVSSDSQASSALERQTGCFS